MNLETAEERREALWVDIAPSLRRIIGRSVTAADLDDVLQDVAERFFRHAPEFPSSDEGLAWATVVARRRLIDQSRRTRPIPTDDLRAVSSGDTERSALGKLALECARRFMSEHNIRESWIIGGGGPTDARDRMSRSRARRRLADHVGRKVGWPVLIPRMRWLAPALGVTAMVPLPFMWSPAPTESRPAHQDSSPAIRGGESDSAVAVGAPPVEIVAVPKLEMPAEPIDHTSPEGPSTVTEAPLPWGSARVQREPDPETGEEPTPLLCAWGLKLAPATCIPHPIG